MSVKPHSNWEPLSPAKLRHELRTPLNHIVGYSEMLLEEADLKQPAVKESLEEILRLGRRLQALLQERLAEDEVSRGLETAEALEAPARRIAELCDRIAACCSPLPTPEFASDIVRIQEAARRWMDLVERRVRRASGLPPARPPSGSQALAAAEAGSSRPFEFGALRAERVLIAEDEEGNRELLRRKLSRMGFRVAVCADGLETLRRLEEDPVDLLILDVLMPGIDGMEVLRRIRARPELQYLPVIVTSALDETDKISRCIELGAEDYLTKPIDAHLLRARLRAALEKKRLRDAEQVYLRRIQEERAKSEKLLLNILPAPIAERLKRGETSIVEAFPDATVLFADLAGFTGLARAFSPERVVRLLDEIFSEFDQLAARHGLEKVKTIGDAYMAVGGAPQQRPDHAEAAARMALGMQAALEAFSRRQGLTLRMRVGMAAGPVIAGIIGRDKFSYDLWGDTVNTASRMETLAEPGTIQTTESLALRLRPRFSVRKRGVLEVRGKGPMPVWILEGERQAKSASDA